MLTKTKISESIVYVISQLICLGGREIAQEGRNIPEVSPKLRAQFWEFKISPQPQHSKFVYIL